MNLDDLKMLTYLHQNISRPSNPYADAAPALERAINKLEQRAETEAAELPALPDETVRIFRVDGIPVKVKGYTSVQMLKYARSALAMHKIHDNHDYKTVGEAHPMPGVDGAFTMCAFSTSIVPPGALLFVRFERDTKKK